MKPGDESNLICHPPLEVTKGDHTSRGGEDVIEFKNIKAGLWGIVLQYVSDIAVIAGFVSGIIKK